MTAPPAISEGATGPRGKWAQYLLVCRAQSCNQIDGIFGLVTKTAVGEYQRDSRLPVDGVVGPADWAALGGDGVQPPTLAQGSRGPVAGKLQTALSEGRGNFAPEPAWYSPSTANTGAIRSGSPRAMRLFTWQILSRIW